MRRRTIVGGMVLLGFLLCLEHVSAQRTKRDPIVQGKSIREWSKELQSKEVLPRIRAINALLQAGPEARSATPELIALFSDSEATLLHPLAVVALTRIGADAVPALQKALTNPNENTRASAALILGAIGERARRAIPTLIQALGEEQPSVRQAAARALGRLNRDARTAIPALAKSLKDADPFVRIEAAGALWSIRNDVRGVPVLQDALKSDNSDLIQRSLTLLNEMGAKAKPSLPALRELLSNKDVSMRVSAAETMARLSENEPQAVATLVDASKSSNRAAIAALGSVAGEKSVLACLQNLSSHQSAELRREAACSLLHAPVEARRATLERGLRDADVGVRWWSALGLATDSEILTKREEELLYHLRRPLIEIGEDDPTIGIILDVERPTQAVEGLRKILATKSIRFRRTAVQLLSRLGLDDRSAFSDLVECLRSDDKLLRRGAAEALATQGIGVLPDLVKMLGNADPRLREGAARAVGRFGIAGRSALPSLERLANDPQGAVRTQVALALWLISQNAESSLPVLNGILKDVDQADRWEAVEAIGIIGSRSRPPIRGITEVLATALKDRDVRVRVEAARQLWQRERQANVVVPLLREGVGDRDALTRALAIETLGELSGNDRAVGLLLQALADRDLELRLLASESLARSGEKVVPRLIAALDARNAAVQLGTLRSLGLLGASAKSARDKVSQLTKAADGPVRDLASWTMTQILIDLKKP